MEVNTPPKSTIAHGVFFFFFFPFLTLLFERQKKKQNQGQDNKGRSNLAGSLRCGVWGWPFCNVFGSKRNGRSKDRKKKFVVTHNTFSLSRSSSAPECAN